jgi:hypothetical protein
MSGGSLAHVAVEMLRYEFFAGNVTITTGTEMHVDAQHHVPYIRF